MKSQSAAIQSHIAERKGRNAHALLWFEAKNRVTQAVEEVGIWTGVFDATFSIDGVDRDYVADGSVITLPPIKTEVGLVSRSYSITLSTISESVQLLLETHSVRNAPFQLHIAEFELGSHALIDNPERALKGKIRRVTRRDPAVGGQPETVLEVKTATFSLEKVLALKKSSESLQQRAPSEEFRQYIDATGVVECVWGEERATSPQ